MPRSAATISASLKKVPPFPPVAVKLLNLLAGPAVDSNAVADLIASDATFTARLLQRVNSAEFGFLSDITSVRRAVALLGLDATRHVILAHAMGAYSQGGLKTEAMRRSWRHTLATAVLAEEIAAACEDYAGAAFTAGIMHDIGRLGLLVAYPEEYENVIRNAAGHTLDLLDFEQEEFGVQHAEAGRMLGEQWQLPVDLSIIAGRHHDPCEGTELSLLRVVHVACRLADALGYDIVAPLTPLELADVIAELPPTARTRLTQSPAEFRQRVDQRIQEFDSESAAASPEETLALLASTAPADPQAQENAAESGPPAESAEPEPGASENAAPAKSQRWLIVTIVMGAAAAAGLVALWLMR
ncbi:MAG TPA: HDOD domain-containing protein [Bryobacteraceae bacterium]|nr:HDOD domain-containing protein [Bryobacteraceae bacterium]